MNVQCTMRQDMMGDGTCDECAFQPRCAIAAELAEARKKITMLENKKNRPGGWA